MIQCRAVEFAYQSVKIFSGLTFHLPRGGYLVLSGPARSGKTTLVRLMAGLIFPRQGEISIAGISLRDGGHSAARLRRVRRETGGMGGIHTLLGDRTVLENITLGAELAGVAPRAARKSAMELAGKYRLNHVTRQYPHMISEVERRAAQLARAEAGRRPLIVADAPADGLDEAATAFLHERLAALHLAGITILYLTSGAGPATGPDQRLRLVDGEAAP